jgi:AraC-like DNA-binding protein
MVGIRFKPAGAQAFLRTPLGELADSHVDLDDLWGPDALAVRDRVCDARSDVERLEALQTALVARLDPDYIPHPAVSAALCALTDGAARVGPVAARTGLGHRRFTDVFRSGVGMTPKTFARLGRFRRTLAQIDDVDRPDWAELAVLRGFADQAHMIREFRAFSGLTPGDHLVHRRHPTKDDHVAVAR